MKSQLPTISFAVIGVGLIGPRHCQTVVESKEARLVAIVDPAPAGALFAAELTIICTPNYVHVAMAKELSTAGVHILLEKPISESASSGRSLIAHLATTKVKTLVGHHRRFNPFMVKAKQIISRGDLGVTIAVNGLWVLHKPKDYFDSPTEWRRGNTGGPILINLIHDIDFLHHLFGPITRVHAESTISQRGHEAEEGAALTLRFKSGVVGTFITADNVSSPYNFESGTGGNPLIPKTGQDFYRVFGSDASLSIPDLSIWSYKGTTKSWNSELTKETESVVEKKPFVLQLEHFCRVIRGEEEPSCTAEAGLGALIVCQAIKEALETNQTVDIEEYEL